MAENEWLIRAPVADVFAILTDGWTYAAWVAGASRVRAVDEGFPQPGHSLHHSVGVWPLVIDDSTTVLQYEPLRFLQLRVRAWPTGEGQVEFVATDRDGDCHLVMREQAVKRTGGRRPAEPDRPDPAVRNHETLRRLALLAEKNH